MNDDQDLSAADRKLLAALRDLPAVEPRADITSRFRARARAEAEAMARAQDVAVPFRGLRRPWVSMVLAASLMIAVTGAWWLDRARREAEMGQLRAELSLALKDLSAAKRMQAIASTEQAAVRDDGLAAALVDALVSDPNPNVRVAAAEALAIVASPETFASGAGKALATERSPFVQAALVDGSRRLSPAARVRLLQILLARPDVDPDLRARVNQQSSSL